MHSSFFEGAFWGERSNSLTQQEPLQQSSRLLREAIFPPAPDHSVQASYRAIEHSAGTSRSPTSATKSILKQHSLPFPHYFTCQMLTKTVPLLRGAIAHLLPALAPAKDFVIPLQIKEYTINLSAPSTSGLRQTRPRTLTSFELGNGKKKSVL